MIKYLSILLLLGCDPVIQTECPTITPFPLNKVDVLLGDPDLENWYIDHDYDLNKIHACNK